eukprot:427988_1
MENKVSDALQLSVNKACVVVHGNLYFNNALIPHLSWPNMPHYDEMYKQKLQMDNNFDSRYNINTENIKLLEFKQNELEDDKNDFIEEIKSDRSDKNSVLNSFVPSIGLSLAASKSSQIYLNQSSTLKWVDIITFINKICMVSAYIILILSYDSNIFHKTLIFWCIYFCNIGGGLISHTFKTLFCCFKTKKYKIFNNKTKYRLQSIIDVSQMILFMYFCGFTRNVSTVYASIMLVLLVGNIFIIIAKQSDNAYILHFNPTQKLFTDKNCRCNMWREIFCGLQTVPFLYYSSNSYFHNLWFQISIILYIIVYPFVVKFMDLLIMNVCNNICVYFLAKECEKSVGSSIGNKDIKNIEFPSLMFLKNKRVQLLNKIKGLISILVMIGWTILLVVLCVIYLLMDNVSHAFEGAWCMLSIFWPVVFLVMCFNTMITFVKTDVLNRE